MGSHPTNKRRKAKQKAKARYAKLRERLQLAGALPTVPEGAVRNEVVPPSTQTDQAIPSLDRLALRDSWAVPDVEKPRVIDRLLEQVHRPDATPLGVVMSVRALLLADQRQYERDHPKEAGVAKGGTEVKVALSAADPYAMYRQALIDSERDEIEERIQAEERGVAVAESRADAAASGGTTES